jgi:hypothetical protein
MVIPSVVADSAPSKSRLTVIPKAEGNNHPEEAKQKEPDEIVL